MVLLFAAFAAPALAQNAEPVCVQRQAVPGFEAWGSAAASSLTIGRFASLPLSATARLDPLPTRMPVVGSHAGQFEVRIATPGRYRIALSGKAWIEVVRGGKPIASTAHGHGPACSGIAKIVGFDLVPGTYLVQLSEAKEARIGAMIAGPSSAGPAGGTPGA